MRETVRYQYSLQSTFTRQTHLAVRDFGSVRNLLLLHCNPGEDDVCVKEKAIQPDGYIERGVVACCTHKLAARRSNRRDDSACFACSTPRIGTLIAVEHAPGIVDLTCRSRCPLAQPGAAQGNRD